MAGSKVVVGNAVSAGVHGIRYLESDKRSIRPGQKVRLNRFIGEIQSIAGDDIDCAYGDL
jgi:hypothetical protein